MMVSNILEKMNWWVDCVFWDHEITFDNVTCDRLLKNVKFQTGRRGGLLKRPKNYFIWENAQDTPEVHPPTKTKVQVPTDSA